MQAKRLQLLLKPAHAHKLAKIFDPFNENAKMIEDPKEAQRKEETSSESEYSDDDGAVLNEGGDAVDETMSTIEKEIRQLAEISCITRILG